MVLKVVDVAYPMEKGLHEAIKLSADVLGQAALVKEQTLLEKYFHELSDAQNKVACGPSQTMEALDQGAVDTLIVWEQLPLMRSVARHSGTDQTKVLLHPPNARSFVEMAHADPQWKLVEQEVLADWLIDRCKGLGAKLALVSGSSELGTQFIKTFGGVGAMLRYELTFGQEEEVIEQEEDDDDFTMDDDDCVALDMEQKLYFNDDVMEGRGIDGNGKEIDGHYNDEEAM